MSLKLEGELIGTKTIESLNTREEKTLDFVYTLTSLGTFNMTVTVDPENAIDELDESNNNLTIRATVIKKPGMLQGYWTPDTEITSGLSGTISRSAPTVFNKDGISYLIAGTDDGIFYGYNWTSSAWQQDDAIISGLGDVGSQSAPEVFCMNGTWYLIAGRMHGFNGFNWTGSTWQQDDAIVSGLACSYHPGYTNYLNKPAVFYKDGTWYLISGNMPQSTVGGWKNQIRFFGHKWTGSAWEDSGIVSGLPGFGSIYYSAPTVFYVDNVWYLISGCGSGEFPGWNWTYLPEAGLLHATWQQDDAVILGLKDVGSLSTPTVFCMNETWYLISGEASGGLYGFHYKVTTATNPPDLTPTSLQPTTLHLDQLNTLTATIRNDGEGNASAFNVSLKLGELLIGTKTVDALNIGEEKSVDFRWTPTSTGTFNLTVTADPENVIDEFDETDNAMIVMVTVERASTPFLVSGRVNYENGDAASNLTVTVTNPGTSDEFTVKTATGSNCYCALTDTRRMSVGDTIRITTTDGINSNETNHTVTANDMNNGGFGEDLALAAAPDLTIAKIALKTPGYANEENVLGVGVKNIGRADAGSFNVSLSVDGTPMGEQTVSSLAVGETAEFEYTWTPAGTGEHALSATADVNSEVEESDETNNDLARTSVIIKPTDWPQFHYNIVHTGFSPCSAPDTNETFWISDDISAIGGTSTVVAEGKVFAYSGLTGLDSGDSTLYCLDESTGAMLWTTSIPAPAWGSWSSPAYHDGKVFTSTDIEAGCYNAATGEQIWVFENPTGEPSVNGGPVVADGKVIVNDWKAGHYYCLDEETGELLWTFTEEQTGDWNVGYTQGVPAYEDGKFYITTWVYIGGNVYCIDADTGYVIWNQTTPLDTCGSPTVADGTVYVTNYNFFGDDAAIYAMDAGNGDILWNYTIQRTDSTPAVAYGNVYVTGGAKGFSDVQTYCFNATTGDLVWETDTADIIGGWTCSVAVADGKVFVGTEGGDSFDYANTYALDAFTGDVVWSYPKGGSSPAVADGTVFTIGGGRVYAFYSETVKLPDLTVTAIGTPTNLRNEVINSISATVENIGGSAAENFDVSLDVGGTQVDTATIVTLAAGENTTVEFLWTPAATGSATLTVTADAGNSVEELDESNNELTKDVEVILPAGVTFDLKKLDLNSNGILKAYITLPVGYDVADIDVSTVECEGAHAFGDGSVIPGKQALEVKFRIQDLVDVPTGDAVSLSVTGELTTGERFEGSDMVEVTAK